MIAQTGGSRLEGPGRCIAIHPKYEAIIFYGLRRNRHMQWLPRNHQNLRPDQGIYGLMETVSPAAPFLLPYN